MHYEAFRDCVETYPVFSSHIFQHLTDRPHVLRNQVAAWQKKNKVLCLKRGLYTLQAKDRQSQFSAYFLANQLYPSAYISLESALSFYGLIPEAVHATTSVSTKKTKDFTNALGHFIYKHIKPSLFAGFTQQRDEFGLNYLMATPEKALVDFLYLNSSQWHDDDLTYLFEGLRLQNIDTLDREKLMHWAELTRVKKVLNLVKRFIENYYD